MKSYDKAIEQDLEVEGYNIRYYRSDKGDPASMDIKMPVMNGLEATRKIREFNLDIPVVAITAFAFENERKQAMDAGCNAHFPKPIKKELLLKAISDLTTKE